MVVTIDPDDFLMTGRGRVWTPERSARAWQRAFEALDEALASETGPLHRIVVVCGLQGAGKSTWIARQVPLPGTVYFDAALPCARHRKPVLDRAAAHRVPVDAVWIRTPLIVALERNRGRSLAERVPEDSIRSVDRLFEPPTPSEGFRLITVVEGM